MSQDDVYVKFQYLLCMFSVTSFISFQSLGIKETEGVRTLH